jgi:hypothetical protein
MAPVVIGDKFGGTKVIDGPQFVTVGGKIKAFWTVECECGHTIEVREDKLAKPTRCQGCRKTQAGAKGKGRAVEDPDPETKNCRSCKKARRPEEFDRLSDDGILRQVCNPCIRDRLRTTRRANLLKRYGISFAEFESMLDNQDHKCEICGHHLCLGGTKAFLPNIDHDHRTGKIRGLLCNGCNIGLGGFRDKASALRSAIAYLAKYSSKPVKRQQTPYLFDIMGD